MKEPTYTFSCNLLVEPPKLDRFYMDMRVYSVKPHAVESEEHDRDALVWRGIYLAFEVSGAVGKS